MNTAQITDGTFTVDFTTNAFSILRWPLKVATRRTDPLGLLYGDEIEEIDIIITGTSSADVIAQVVKLNTLLDQAHAMALGDESVAPVLFKVRPYTASAAGVLSTLLLGPRADGAQMLLLPDDYTLVPAVLNTEPTIVVKRAPLWLGGTETEVSSASTTDDPAHLTTVAFSETAPFPWPTDITLTMAPEISGAPHQGELLLILSNAANKLHLVQAESTDSKGASMNIDTDAAASGGSYVQANPQGAPAALYLRDTIVVPATARQFAVWIMANNPSTTNEVSWDVRYTFLSDDEVYGWGRTTRITHNVNLKKFVSLGMYTLPAFETPLDLYIQFTPVGSGTHPGDSLEIDYIALAVLDENTRTIRVPYFAPTGQFTDDPSKLHIDHRMLTHRSPLMWGETDSGGGGYVTSMHPGWKGDARLAFAGDVVSCIAMGQYWDGTTETTRKWHLQPGGLSTNWTNFTLSATRQNAYRLIQ
jgi:hypothetical protein